MGAYGLNKCLLCVKRGIDVSCCRPIASSLAKMIIDAALVKRLISSQFPGWASLPVTPVEFDGWDNRTFRLGEKLSVRLPSAAGYAEQVDKEQRWLPVLASELPLPIPAPVAVGDPGDGYPWKWSVYRWLDGEIATADRISVDGSAGLVPR